MAMSDEKVLISTKSGRTYHRLSSDGERAQCGLLKRGDVEFTGGPGVIGAVKRTYGDEVELVPREEAERLYDPCGMCFADDDPPTREIIEEMGSILGVDPDTNSTGQLSKKGHYQVLLGLRALDGGENDD
jgi:hypothetical protein